jgi:uncharacterized protein (DUF1501 family)
MSRSFDLTRRAALASGVSLVMMARAARADEALAKKKLVVIIARGGMDGLSVSPPIGDPAYRSLRGQIAIPGDLALKLDSDFALHPKLVAIHALALKGRPASRRQWPPPTGRGLTSKPRTCSKAAWSRSIRQAPAG